MKLQLHVQYRERVSLAVGFIAAEDFEAEVAVNVCGLCILLVYVDVESFVSIDSQPDEPFPDSFSDMSGSKEQSFYFLVLDAHKANRLVGGKRYNQGIDGAQCFFGHGTKVADVFFAQKVMGGADG